MSSMRIVLLTSLAMLAFAGNSLLCRLALTDTGIDAASFTTIRIVSGALVLVPVARWRNGAGAPAPDWPSAIALFAYAACFSFAYVSLSAGTGALLLFGAVQAAMIGYGLWRGESLAWRRIAGLACAFAGIVGLVLPGITAPPLQGAALMLAAGVAWGIFSIRGKGAGDPTAVMAGSFLRAAPLAAVLSIVTLHSATLDAMGVAYAIASGALTSGVGYVIWYTALRGLSVTSAAIVQLTVPMIAAAAGVILLNEPLTARLLIASAIILGGVALALTGKKT
ncbi:DMT family transporter [Noviherbaspirillum cavernae]|uniref:DMT family transporter n=1 Tax=Noviherbaspirillum cavernae TaxID=2320862 RepID=A0A418X6H1_9BURK|nr:DMT family transporter [Noviherbaspirillum cavernae]RJG08063.1 DMT family transporter [Noviherbaspirillum cavernae]